MGLKEELAQGEKARQEVKKPQTNKEQMLCEGNVGKGALCRLVGQGQFSNLSDVRESRGGLSSGKIEDASQHKQTTLPKSGSRVERAGKQEQASSGERPVVMKGACFLESSQNCVESL